MRFVLGRWSLIDHSFSKCLVSNIKKYTFATAEHGHHIVITIQLLLQHTEIDNRIISTTFFYHFLFGNSIEQCFSGLVVDFDWLVVGFVLFVLLVDNQQISFRIVYEKRCRKRWTEHWFSQIDDSFSIWAYALADVGCQLYPKIFELLSKSLWRSNQMRNVIGEAWLIALHLFQTALLIHIVQVSSSTHHEITWSHIANRKSQI